MQSTEHSKKNPLSLRSWGLFILLFFVIGFCIWLQWSPSSPTHRIFQPLSAPANQADAANTTQLALLQGQVKALQSQVTLMNTKWEKQQRARIAQAQKAILAEAFYLLHMAVYHLQTDQNLPLITTLLENADLQLSQLSQARYNELHQAVLLALTEVRALKPIDTNAIFNALDQAKQQLPALPNRLPLTQASADSLHLHGWARAWYQIKQLIIIEPNDNAFPIYLTETQRADLQLQLQSLFAQAQWAVLQRNANVYQRSLTDIIRLVQNAYSQQTPPLPAYLAQLNSLLHTPVSLPINSTDLLMRAMAAAQG